MTQSVEVAISPLENPLSYLVPENLVDTITVGTKVQVPLGKRFVSGFVVGLGGSNSFQGRLKAIKERQNSGPVFDLEVLELCRWVSRYYGHPLSEVLDVAIPALAPERVRKTIRIKSPEDIAARVQSLSKKAKECVDFIQQHQAVLWDELLRHFGRALINRLLKEEVLQLEIGKKSPPPLALGVRTGWAKQEVQLNPAQKTALDEILAACKKQTFAPFLLHGVTGSGKTEVYLEAAREVLSQGKGVLVLVPEIALTPQLVSRFEARLPFPVAILHSALSKRLRWDTWQNLIEGSTKLALGARSALFAPVKDLALIIVDEEHETSYKQSDGLRYQARDVSLVRGQMANCPVVLGSATPSLESYHNAQTGKYRLLELPARPNQASTFRTEVIDLGALKFSEMKSANISLPLYQALEQTINAGEQAFLLYNRRGFASFLQCDTCRAVVSCPYCSVTLTFHQGRNALCCHYCGIEKPRQELCPTCLKPDSPSPRPGRLMLRGAGTEKVFDEMRALFPTVATVRLDRDAINKFEDYQAIFDAIRQGKAQVVVGTQMLAKGHDLPNVTLVGVIDTDVGLHLPDFRASERIFQLLTQASGRVGRAEKPGLVYLQTRLPTHPSVACSAAQDYCSFAKAEIAERKIRGFPPFARILRIVVSSLKSEEVEEVSNNLKALLQELSASSPNLTCGIVGPAPAPLSKVRARFRYHLLARSLSHGPLIAIREAVKQKLKIPKNTRVTFDLDPYDML